MAMKPLKSVKWPNLPDRYWVVQADGSYQQMTVGNAEQLVGTVGIQDKVPYNFRTAGGAADIGDREIDKIIGGTVAWNQLAKALSSSNWSNETGVTSSYADGVATISSTTVNNGIVGQFPCTKDHIYFVTYKCKISSNTITSASLSTGIAGIVLDHGISAENTWETAAGIQKATNNGTAGYLIGRGGAYTDLMFKDVQLIDLTQMFGSTIADYIYSLEQSTAGAGVAWFRKLFPKPYYSYNAGQLMSVKTNAHKMVGFNQFDKSTAVDGKKINSSTGEEATNAIWARSDYIRVMPNTVYYTNAYGVGQDYTITLYDASKNYIGYNYNLQAGTFNTGDASYVILSTMKAYVGIDDLVLNLHWDGERDGEYEPYEAHTYPLDDVELRGIPKLDADNNLYYDGDEYASDGTVTRKRKEINLGEQDWTYNSTYQFFITSLEDAKSPATADAFPDLVCTKYEEKTPRFVVDTSYGNGIALSKDGFGGIGKLVVRDTAYTDAATFKSAMSGVMLDYPLATPTTESAEPYQNPQVVNDWGTEEYVDAPSTAATPTRDVAIPVGHDTFYQPNLRAKLEMSPDSPADGDGDYIVRQTNGVNAYVKLIKELPTAPSENGTYHLKLTVASGTPTLTWEADT